MAVPLLLAAPGTGAAETVSDCADEEDAGEVEEEEEEDGEAEDAEEFAGTVGGAGV